MVAEHRNFPIEISVAGLITVPRLMSEVTDRAAELSAWNRVGDFVGEIVTKAMQRRRRDRSSW
jgi:hypothetical protein